MRREREWISDPLSHEMEVQAGLCRAFKGVLFHHTLHREGLSQGGVKIMSGNLHETQGGAAEVRKKIIENAGRSDLPHPGYYTPQQIQARTAQWEQAEVVELEVGEEYRPAWRVASGKRTHGADDGTHNSELPKP